MTWLLEEPWPILLVGVAIEAVLVVPLVQTRRLAVMLAMVGVLLLTAVLLAVEHFVVTPAEEVQGVIYAITAALEANDQQAVLAHISKSATRVQTAVRQGMTRFEITKARIVGKLKVTIGELTIPPSATASFQGLIHGRAKGDGHNVTHFGRFTVKLHHEGDVWRVSDYEEHR